MISFAQDYSKYNQRAIKAALLSTIPGLGQLFNRRIDKAIAFFLVDIANVAFIAVLLGYVKIPFSGLESTQFVNELANWRAGTVPFFVIQTMMLSYVLYSQFDAFRDAQAASLAPGQKPELSLSHTTCASYLVHMGAMSLLCLLILFKICPTFHPEDSPQITLTFELDTPTAAEQEKPQGLEGKMGQESDHETDAHSKDKPVDDLVQAGTRAAEMSASRQNDRPDMKLAADETEAVASKQIVTTVAKQMPQEVSSHGASDDANKTSKVANDQVKQQDASKTSPETQESAETNPVQEISELAKPKLAQLPKIDDTSAQIDRTAVATAIPEVGPFAGLNPADPYSYNQSSPALIEKSTPTGQEGPSMLGFMDSELSNDESMRQLWSEMSGNISRYVKANPMKGEGLAMAQFRINRYGQPLNIQTAGPTELTQSIVDTIRRMPTVMPSAGNENRMYFQLKTSHDAKATFISLEVNSQPSTVSEESLSDFKYQTDLQAYLKGIKKAVYSSWKPPVQEGIKPAMVGFKVSTSGRISNHHIVQSSGDPKMDRAALNAALSVSKWTQPPAGTNEDMDVCMVLQRCKNCEGEQKQAAAATVTGVNPAIIDPTTRLPEVRGYAKF